MPHRPNHRRRSIAPIFALLVALLTPADGGAVTYYVRQSVGNDAHDGTSAETAWEHVALLSRALRHGDVSYVGPGLYREAIQLRNRNDASGARIEIIADVTGRHTGDPPGDVTIAGSDAVDEDAFTPHSKGMAYVASVPGAVLGVVELDGPRKRYGLAAPASGPKAAAIAAIDFVTATPASFFYDEKRQLLYLHTSDGQPPQSHEIEIMRRADGIAVVGSPRVAVIGFTLRDAAHAGIRFWNGADGGIAIDNTAFGHHQGIEVYGSDNVLIHGNTLFLNDNSGVYFLKASTNGIAIDNVAYDNVKGLRWGSGSLNGVAIDNELFDNRERGISIENADGAVLWRNHLWGNRKSQLLVNQSAYDSDDNCFERDSSSAFLAEFSASERYETLPPYQRIKRQDLTSRDHRCGAARAGLADGYRRGSAAQRKPKSASR